MLLGDELDSVRLAGIKAALPKYGLEDVTLDIVQGKKGVDMESLRGIISTERSKTLVAQRQLAEDEQQIKELRDSIGAYMQSIETSRMLLPELTALFPEVVSVSTSRGVYTFWADSVMQDSMVYVVNVVADDRVSQADKDRMYTWLKMRLMRNDVQLVVVEKQDGSKR